ncbi:hypothetical protein [Vreelandella massiliensis]|uniref:hypothetical protein n=1 Tax=Vreelandella massiliensis TaxID=1816686 RepID=UPI00096AAF25|nr:hypothetical protein [Halomonas massiliensis]
MIQQAEKEDAQRTLSRIDAYLYRRLPAIERRHQELDKGWSTTLKCLDMESRQLENLRNDVDRLESTLKDTIAEVTELKNKLVGTPTDTSNAFGQENHHSEPVLARRKLQGVPNERRLTPKLRQPQRIGIEHHSGDASPILERACASETDKNTV